MSFSSSELVHDSIEFYRLAKTELEIEFVHLEAKISWDLTLGFLFHPSRLLASLEVCSIVCS